jgi:hypothetical protein
MKVLSNANRASRYAIENERFQRFHRDYPSAKAAQVDVTKLGGEAATPDKR